MTLGGKLISLFPAFLLILILGDLVWMVTDPSPFAVVFLVFAIYVLPPLAHRLHSLIWPVVEGVSRLDAPNYSPWWASHKIQSFYEALPFLERALRLLPGCYSSWLRFWGSEVGRRVHWAPTVEITDRSLIRVGDDVVFGHKVACYGHLIRIRNGEMRLTVRSISIGDRVFIGAGSRLGPGASIADDTVVPLLTDIGVGKTYDGAGDGGRLG